MVNGVSASDYNNRWFELKQAKQYAVEDLEACKKNGDEKKIAQAEKNLADIKLEMINVDKSAKSNGIDLLA